MTPTKLTLAERLAAVTAEVERLGHDGQMQGGGSYPYTSINAIADAARPLLAKHGVALIPATTELLSDEPLAKGRRVVIRRDWVIAGGGESVQASSIGEGADTSDKAVGKAHTYARKHLILDLLNLSTGEDPDSERPDTAPRAYASGAEQRRAEWHGRGQTSERPKPEPKTNYENVMAVGLEQKLTRDAIHDILKTLGLSMPSDLNFADNYEKAINAVRGAIKVDDKGGLPTGVDKQVPAKPPFGEPLDPEVPVITAPQAKRYQAIRSKAKVSEERGKEIILDLTGQDSHTKIPRRLYDTVIATIEAEGEKS